MSIKNKTERTNERKLPGTHSIMPNAHIFFYVYCFAFHVQLVCDFYFRSLFISFYYSFLRLFLFFFLPFFCAGTFFLAFVCVCAPLFIYDFAVLLWKAECSSSLNGASKCYASGFSKVFSVFSISFIFLQYLANLLKFF